MSNKEDNKAVSGLGTVFNNITICKKSGQINISVSI